MENLYHNRMRRKEYLKPVAEELDIKLPSIICTSPGIDPSGIGQDFNWGNGTGVNLGGSGADFNFAN